MKVKYLVMGFMAALFLFTGGTPVNAEIYKIRLDCQTLATSSAPSQRLRLSVQIADTLRRPPDAIKSLKVTAPNAAATVIDLTNHCWSEYDNDYWKDVTPADFPEGRIPSGTYKAVAVDKEGKSLSTSETLTATFLSCPIITNIREGQTLTTLTPRIAWTAVEGAKSYRVRLKNITWGEPVYYPPNKTLLLSRYSFPIPKGVLLPGMEYSIQIEARDSDYNLNKRSRSDWINFKTVPLTTSTDGVQSEPVSAP